MIILALRIINQLVLGSIKYTPIRSIAPGVKGLQYDVTMRCWPIDMDAFMHMNNAMYLRCSELTRWRIFPQTGSLSAVSNGALFLLAEADVSYYRPIEPFQRFTIRTDVTVSENKWLHYKHTFMQDASTIPPNQSPTVYAIADCKAVLKERSGKTIRIDELAQHNEFYRKLIE